MTKRKLKRIRAKKPDPKAQSKGVKLHATWCDIRADADGTLDEIVVEGGASVHIEQMDSGRWWMAIYKNDQRQVVWFESDTPIRARTERDT